MSFKIDMKNIILGLSTGATNALPIIGSEGSHMPPIMGLSTCRPMAPVAKPWLPMYGIPDGTHVRLMCLACSGGSQSGSKGRDSLQTVISCVLELVKIK